MIEILALIFLTKKMAAIATQKGLKANTWKLYMVLTWFGAEIAGALIGYLLLTDTALAALVGYACAIGSYFVLRNILSKKPDVDDNWINEIGAQPQDLPNA